MQVGGLLSHNLYVGKGVIRVKGGGFVVVGVNANVESRKKNQSSI